MSTGWLPGQAPNPALGVVVADVVTWLSSFYLNDSDDRIGRWWGWPLLNSINMIVIQNNVTLRYEDLGTIHPSKVPQAVSLK